MNRGGRKKKKKERKKEKKEEDIQSDCCQLEKKRFFRSGKQFNRFLSRTISFPTNSFPTDEQKKKKRKKIYHVANRIVTHCNFKRNVALISWQKEN